MVYIPNTDTEREQMLKTIGVSSFEDLVSNIPASLRLKGDLKLPEALSEYEIMKHMNELGSKNVSVSSHANFIGGGAYDHFIPAIVDHVISRPEFYTAYTPYQAELSQGTLQAMYEFQSCVSLISGMDISNASMYDGASAMAEAVIMACNVSRKKVVLMANSIHPDYISVVKTYTSGVGIALKMVGLDNGTIDLKDLKNQLSDDVAAVVVQHPNFFGCLEEVEEIKSMMEAFPKMQFVVSYNPISVGLVKSPGEYGADIAVAEGQPMGIPLSFGGPYIGFLSSKDANIRKMPGRMAGKTIDAKGKEGFVLALQTREQHIKRERATSNICSNQGLLTVASLTYMTYMGKEGFAQVAKQCYNKAHYLADQVKNLDGYELKYDKEFFNEFVIKTDKSIEKILDAMEAEKMLGGLNLARYGMDGLMVAVTEKRNKEELDKFVSVLKSV